MTLWICMSCGQVRESSRPLACARDVYHSTPLPMEVLAEDVTWWGEPPHPVFGKTAAMRGYEWLGDLSPDAVVTSPPRP